MATHTVSRELARHLRHWRARLPDDAGDLAARADDVLRGLDASK